MPHDEMKREANSTINAAQQKNYGLGGSLSMQGEPGVAITWADYRQALKNAERAADEMMKHIESIEQQRNEFARQIGAMQETLDRLHREREETTRHVRMLQSQGPESPRRDGP